MHSRHGHPGPAGNPSGTSSAAAAPTCGPIRRPIAAVVLVTVLASGLPALEPLGFRAIFDRLGGAGGAGKGARELLGPVVFLAALWLLRYVLDLGLGHGRLAGAAARPPRPAGRGHRPAAHAAARLPPGSRRGRDDDPARPGRGLAHGGPRAAHLPGDAGRHLRRRSPLAIMLHLSPLLAHPRGGLRGAADAARPAAHGPARRSREGRARPLVHRVRALPAGAPGHPHGQGLRARGGRARPVHRLGGRRAARGARQPDRGGAPLGGARRVGQHRPHRRARRGRGAGAPGAHRHRHPGGVPRLRGRALRAGADAARALRDRAQGRARPRRDLRRARRRGHRPRPGGAGPRAGAAR